MTEQDFFERYQYNRTQDRLGSGSVFRAMDTLRGRAVAVKELLANDSQFTLKREVELTNEVDFHPNVLRYENVYRLNVSDVAMDYAIMKYFEKGNLESLLNTPLSISDKKQIIEGILQGIAHLHKSNIIHRDLKIANILMDFQGEKWIPKIADFGLSRLGEMPEDDPELSPKSSVAYAAPEQIDGKPVQKNTNLWTFGIIAYRILTGEMPFESNKQGQERVLDICTQIMESKLPENLNNLQEPFQTVIKKCLVKDTNQRVQSAEALVLILQQPITEPLPQAAPPKVEFDSEQTVFIQDFTKKIIENDKTVIQAPVFQQNPNVAPPQYSTDFQPDEGATVIGAPRFTEENNDATVILNKPNFAANKADDATVILDKPNFALPKNDDATVILNKPNFTNNAADDATVILNKPNIPTPKNDDATVVLPKQSQPVFQAPQKDFGNDEATVISSKPVFDNAKKETIPLSISTQSGFSKHKNKILIGLAGLIGLSGGIYLVTAPAPTPVAPVVKVETPVIMPPPAAVEPTPAPPTVIDAPVTTPSVPPVLSNVKKPNVNVPRVKTPTISNNTGTINAPPPVPNAPARAKPEPQKVDDQPDEPLKSAEQPKPTAAGPKTYKITELSQIPEFSDVNDYLKRNVNMPDEAKKNKVKGFVFILATIESDGKVSSAKLLKGLGYGCDEAALEVVRKMPKWKAGKANGQAVRSEISVRVSFN